MYYPKLLLLLFPLLITTSSSELANAVFNKSFVADAELGTTWKNNPSLVHNELPDDHFSVRLIFPRLYDTTKINVGPNITGVRLFACGFFCAGLAATCDAYIFSIFIVNAVNEGSFLHLKSPQVIWSANHNRPVSENAIVQLTELGDLVLYDADGTLVWFANTTNKSVVGMHLTESGNLVLFDYTNREVWRSFDHPTDTLVTGQMLQLGQKLMASISETNWAKGKFYLTVLADGMYAFAGVDTPLAYYRSPTSGNITTNTSAYIALKNGSLEVFTSFRRTEAPDYQIWLPPDAYGTEFVRLDWDGHLRLYQWGDGSGDWVSSDVLDIADPCSYPLACGEYGICSDGQCSCPDAALRQSGLFELIDPRELNRGCFLTDSLSCGSLQKARFLALPNTARFNIIYNWTTNEGHCKLSCLNDCSCKVAFFIHTNDSSGFCFLASDIFSMISVNTQSYSRNFSSYAFVKVQDHRAMLSKQKIAIVLVVTSSTFVASIVVTVLMVLRRKSTEPIEDGDTINQLPGLPTRFSFESLKSATGDFSRKIGAGGSGSVYEGHIDDKQIAVKRLDGINQGETEFLTEVQTVGSINHIHLVSLIGFCAERSHRLLVYEYMPNGSLDKWIFAKHEAAPLDWETRLKIITDVARGLAYLHSDCRQTIAHLDIKPQNILLDEMFSAKVSDFGLAKLIDREHSTIMTRLRGTPGYLAPEWLTSVISEKVDVYSFGIVVMEILCGRRNLDYSQPEEGRHLVSMVQEKAKDDQLLDLIDSRSTDLELHLDEVFRVMKLALWCLQVDTSRRPSMSMVVKVLEGTMGVETDLDLDLVNIDLMVANRAGRWNDVTLQIESILSGPR
ncbi:G-type lectin S-receptor-like serine/threonine-protein kinase [Dichanthelium oligosanthes]|uniref:Receptor-like serine/threonine-protein kinase n=1 Tax=Dichanthelium oligosanthes TaxID=888268 RepID=A0A1E5VU88_9POAL|nr:G-type lectin S-receptor-like serine/threonine-protein kinase [Dichanthelium oligosanthes]